LSRENSRTCVIAAGVREGDRREVLTPDRVAGRDRARGPSALTNRVASPHAGRVQALQVKGADAVARVLRALAVEVEQGEVEVDGRSVELAPSLYATVEVPDDPDADATVLDVRLVHPSRAMDLTLLRRAMSHPGD
jgi:hypothetical protein